MGIARIVSVLDLFVDAGILHHQSVVSENPVLKKSGQVHLLKLVRRWESPTATVQDLIPAFEISDNNSMIAYNQQQQQQQAQNDYLAAAAFSFQHQQQQQQQQLQEQQYQYQMLQQSYSQPALLLHQDTARMNPSFNNNLYQDNAAMNPSFVSNFNHQNSIIIPTNNRNNNSGSTDMAPKQLLQLKSLIISSLRSTGSISKFALIANVSRDAQISLPLVRSAYATMLSEGIISEIDQQQPNQPSSSSSGALVFTRLVLRTVNREQLLIATTLMLSNCRMQKVTALGELSQRNPKWDRDELKLAFRDLINDSFVFEMEGEDGASYVMLAALKEQILAQQQQQQQQQNNNNNNNHRKSNSNSDGNNNSGLQLQPFHVANINGPSPLQQLLHLPSQQPQHQPATTSTFSIIKSTKMGRDLRDDEANFLAQVVKQLESHPDAARDSTTSQKEIPIRSFSPKL